jgi:apolipoprotein N-acyltransferase
MNAASWRRCASAVPALAATAFACALYARAEAPWHALGFVALVPALAVFDRARTAWEAALGGLVLCVLFVLGVFPWFAEAMRIYGGGPAWVSLLLLLALGPVLEPQLVVLALARYTLRRRGAGALRAAFASALLYVGAEWASPKLFGDTLGHGLFPSVWLRQGADLAGAPGLTLLLLLVNDAVLAACRRAIGAREGGFRASAFAAAPPLAAALLVVAALSAYGALRVAELRPASASEPLARVGLVQGDISRYGRMAAQLGTWEATRSILDTYFGLSTEALARGGVDLLVWPETVYPTTFGSPKSAEGAAFDRELAAFVAATGVPLVFGAYDAEAGREFNAAIVLEPEGAGRAGFDAYRKAALFPLTERVPVWLDSPRLRRWLPWLGTWSAGDGPAVLALDLPGATRLRIAPLICYDAVDPALARRAVREGAELLVTLSNDSWFADGAGPRLHFVVSAFRSLETRRPQVRVTNTGISGVIDATGEVSGVLGVHVRGAQVVGVPAGAGVTFFLGWGFWLGPLALACGIALLLPVGAHGASLSLQTPVSR